jgi:riboflavin biosynthesis pyrimidine reductase
VRLLLPQPRPLDEHDLLELYGAGDAPHLRAGFVVTTDGGVAVDGGSRALQSPADKTAFSTLRSVSDAVVVGAGTARAEDYGPVRPRPSGAAWRRERGLAPRPPLVLVSRSLDLDPGARCFTGPAVVVTCAAADPARRAALAEVADVEVAGEDDVDLAAAVDRLRARGLRRLLCEGGPMLLTALLTAGLVDELCLTATPLLLGTAPTLLTRALARPVPLALEHLVDGGSGVLLARWSVRREGDAAAG